MTSFWLLAYTIATTPPACWVTWRLAYRRGVDQQKRRQEQLRRYDEMLDPTRIDEFASGYDKVAAALGLRTAPPADVIDLRDSTDGARWN